MSSSNVHWAFHLLVLPSIPKRIFHLPPLFTLRIMASEWKAATISEPSQVLTCSEFFSIFPSPEIVKKKREGYFLVEKKGGPRGGHSDTYWTINLSFTPTALWGGTGIVDPNNKKKNIFFLQKCSRSGTLWQWHWMCSKPLLLLLFFIIFFFLLP